MLTAGALDDSFDFDGRAITDFDPIGQSYDNARSVAVQQDGKVVVVGRADLSDGSTGAAVARYNVDGSLDTSFSGDGLVLLAGLDANAVAFTADGHIVVAGTSVALLNSDGSLETSFGGGDGIATTPFVASKVVVQASGKIVIGGQRFVSGNDFDLALARFNSDGTLDATFDGDGIVTTDFGATRDTFFALAQGPSDELVAVGLRRAGTTGSFTYTWAVARYNADGVLDNSFSGDGRALAPAAANGGAPWSVAVQSDGKIVVAGNGNGDFRLVRLEADGDLDTLFGTGGVVTTDFVGNNDDARALALLPGGKILVAGFSHQGGTLNDFALACYQADGTLDPNFSGDGLQTTDFTGGDDFAFATAITPDGKLVVAGNTLNPLVGIPDFGVARYTIIDNTAPVAADVNATVSENEPGQFSFAADDADNDDDPASLIYALIGQPSEGTLTLGPGGTFTFDPGNEFDDLSVGQSRTVWVAYKATDSHAVDSNVATIFITVTGSNDGPSASGDASLIDEDQSVVLDVLANDGDPDAGELLSIQGLDLSGTLGNVTINADGTLTYDPAGQFAHLSAGQTAVDRFWYTVTDGAGGTATAPVVITVTGTNDGPLASADLATVSEDGAANLDVLANDADPDAADVLSVLSLDTTGTVGLVTIAPDGTIHYEAAGRFDHLAAGESATDTFQYTIGDGQGGTSIATVSVTILGQNDAPLAGDDAAATDENAPVTLDVLANDSDADQGTVLSVASVDTLGTLGLVTINADGTLTYDPGHAFDLLNAGETATDLFQYTVSDGAGGTATATVSITVRGVSAGPALVAVNDSYEVTEDGKLKIDAAGGLLANDLGATGATVQLVSAPTAGKLHLRDDGSFHYTPGLTTEAGAVDNFRYAVIDSQGNRSEAVVTVYIRPAVAAGQVTLTDGVLRVGGTEGADQIVLTCRHGKLFKNGVNTGIAVSGIKEVHVWGRGGDDFIHVLFLHKSTVIHAGSGNDVVIGGLATDLVYGGLGNDSLHGFGGRDLLVGGHGHDRLRGWSGHDVLVGGDIAGSLTREDLLDVLASWADQRLTEEALEAALVEVTHGDLDRLHGGWGRDWHVAGMGDLVRGLHQGLRKDKLTLV